MRLVMKHDPEEVFRFIVRYKEKHDGNSPTLREICKDCGITSTSHAKHILYKLDLQDRILLDYQGRSRHIRVIGGRWTYEGDRHE